MDYGEEDEEEEGEEGEQEEGDDGMLELDEEQLQAYLMYQEMQAQ